MAKYPTDAKRGLGASRHSTAGVLFGLWLLSALPAAAETAVPPPADVAPEVQMVLSTSSTVTGEPIRYPTGAPARITIVEITLQPGQQTGWHTHPIPLLGYILGGELTVDYGLEGQRTFFKGDGLAETMNMAHNGRNTGQVPVKILAVFIGIEGEANTASASPPAP